MGDGQADEFRKYEGEERRRHPRGDFREADPLWVYRLGVVEQKTEAIAKEVDGLADQLSEVRSLFSRRFDEITHQFENLPMSLDRRFMARDELRREYVPRQEHEARENEQQKMRSTVRLQMPMIMAASVTAIIGLAGLLVQLLR